MNIRHLKLTSARAAWLTLGLAAAGALQAGDYSSTVLSFNPVAYWRLNETTPVPAALTVANQGSVGSAGTGYGVLDVVSGELGVIGNAIRITNPGSAVGFSGSKIDVPFTPGLNPAGSFTVEFWAKPTALVTDLFCPLSALNGDAGVRDGWLFYMTAANQWLFRIGGHSGYAGLAQGGTAKAGEWQQVVGVYEASNNSVSVYVNGVKVGGPVKAAIPFAPNSGRAFRFGATGLTGTLGGYAGNRSLDGLLDEVAIYSGALSPDRIASHYATATSNPGGYAADVLADNPLGYWNCDEPAYVAPNPGSLPVAQNLGSLGAQADGTYLPGVAGGVAGPSFSGFGADSKAAHFNGIVGQVAVPNPDGLNVSSNFTMTAWVKPEATDNLRDIFAHGYVTTPDNREVLLRINAGKYQAGFWDGSDAVATGAIPAGDVGNWVFLAATWDGSTWTLYRHAQPIGSTNNVSSLVGFDAAWSIGSRGAADTESPADGRFFVGTIGEVAVFDQALSAGDLQTIFAAANPPPIILQAPQLPAGTVYVGDSLTLRVVADGLGPFTYAWSKNTTPLGKTSDTLTLNNLKVADGGTYTVTVSNANGSVSRSVNLTVVGAAPNITKQPAATGRFVGAAVSFSVQASGSAPLSYQWSHGPSPIPQATSSTLVIDSVTAGDAGSYTVTVSNDFGQTTSDAAELMVLSLPADYAALVAGDGPLAYWRLGEASGAVAHDYWGGHNGGYNNVTLGQPGYSLKDSDTSVSFTSAGSYVGGVSGSEINFTGGSTAFTLEAWVNGSADQLSGAGIIAKGTGTNGGTGDEQFAVDVYQGVFRFYVRQASDNAAIPVSAAVGPSGGWQHIVAVYDGPGTTMQLYVNGEASGDSAGAPESGPRTSSHPVSIGARRGGVDPAYDLFFNGRVDEVAIYNKALTLDEILAHYTAQYGNNQVPLIEVQPAPATVYATRSVTFSVSAAGTQPLSYQWKKGTGNIANATGSSYTIDAVKTTDAGDYSVVVTNPVGSTPSAAAKLTVLAIPTTDVALPGLVAHYKFDGNLTDATGRGNNGTAVGSISYVDAKIGSGSLHYETDASGDPVVSSYVNLGVRDDLQFGMNSFSVAFWVRLPLNYALGDLPMFGNARNSANNHGYTFAPSYGPGANGTPGGWGWSLFGPSAGINVYGAVGSINDGGWHHLLFSFDRAGTGVTYLDGDVADSRSIVGLGDLNTGLETIIGQDPTGAYPETGSADLDDLGVWNRALTSPEALAIYLAASVNGKSFINKVVSGPIAVELTSGGKVRLTWPAGGVLQAAGAVTGPYQDVGGASPPYEASPTGDRMFYRVKY